MSSVYRFAATVFLALATVCNGQNPAPRAADPPADARLKQLLQARVEQFQKVEAIFIKTQGATSMTELYQVRRDVLAAQVEAADSKDLRVALLQKIVELEKQRHDALSRSGLGKVDLLYSEIRITDAELAVERTKLKKAE